MKHARSIHTIDGGAAIRQEIIRTTRLYIPTNQQRFYNWLERKRGIPVQPDVTGLAISEILPELAIILGAISIFGSTAMIVALINQILKP